MIIQLIVYKSLVFKCRLFFYLLCETFRFVDVVRPKQYNILHECKEKERRWLIQFF
jgi:hypothetical protein